VINGKKLVVVMPAYNAAQTLVQTFRELPHEIVDEVILVDDHSKDETVEVARELGISTIIRHVANLGYGGNQKTCYTAALAQGADIVAMVHPDYQYAPTLCGAMAWMIASGEYDMVLASRILGRGALKGGMPLYKYVANRFLTAFENVFLDVKLSEYHTGYRAFAREVLEALPLAENSDDFVFDNQMIAQAAAFDFRIGEISCPTRYMPEASSINFRRSVKYGFGVLATSLAYWFHTRGLARSRIFTPGGRGLDHESVAERGSVIRLQSARKPGP
jgi:glycosyltransferase involved in cell wall biosynthesis